MGEAPPRPYVVKGRKEGELYGNNEESRLNLDHYSLIGTPFDFRYSLVSLIEYSQH